jgi:hypothetical protein
VSGAPLLVLAAALLLWGPPGDVRARRIGHLRPDGCSGPRAPAIEGAPRRRWLVASAGACVLVGGERLLRAAAPDEFATTRAALRRDLPGACDLLGVCVAAGMPVAGALAAVSAAVPGVLGDQLRTVASLYRLGAEPRRAWADVPGELAGLGRVMVRAGESGAAVVPALTSLAADGRTAERADAEAAVRRAGVWVLAPLGACFLPAFLCLGVVPLVLGIAGDVFR